jgi:hypothetical protein
LLSAEKLVRIFGRGVFLLNKVSMSKRQIEPQLEALFDGYVEIHDIFEVMIDENSMQNSIPSRTVTTETSSSIRHDTDASTSMTLRSSSHVALK